MTFNRSKNIVKVYYSFEVEEYIVVLPRCSIGDNSSYHTDDKNDAFITAGQIAKRTQSVVSSIVRNIK